MSHVLEDFVCPDAGQEENERADFDLSLIHISAPTTGKEKNRWLGQVILRAYFKLLP